MSRTRLFAAALGLSFTYALLAPPTSAQPFQDKKSTLTVTDRIEVPGTILEPGTYVIKVVNVENNRNIVQVANVDETHVYATAIATPHVGGTPPENTTFVYYNTPAGSNRVLRTWFAPNDRFGQDLVYPKERAAELARLTSEKVPEMTAEMSQEITTTSPAEPAPAKVAEEPPPPPRETESTQQPTTYTAENAAPAKELPRTASPYPLLFVFGLLALGAATTLRLARRRAV